ncbi:hypothetical protein Y032_0765g2165 [Ancylostoma ceylanicum]|uniref:Uncharacterized protein n=1 Tax=Ancylostoma ceylanicum TaxID=53326 RepID=A0A016WDU6_9BILA|nr:hypothetical protein Y032_0765g2165 [Ancylostoma ceylanicum]
MKPIPCGSELCPAVQKIIVINAEWGKARPQHRLKKDMQGLQGGCSYFERRYIVRSSVGAHILQTWTEDPKDSKRSCAVQMRPIELDP